MYRKVLDIDLTTKYSRLPPKTKEYFARMMTKIRNCPNYCYSVTKPSNSKGYHVILYCAIDCDICRLCFDDDRHFAYDMARPEYARNVLFDRKERIKFG